MKKKVVYLTHWVAKDTKKEYPHGWGFEPPIVEFPQEMDAAEASNHCKELFHPEFECLGATPREIIDGNFEILGIEPGCAEGSEEWAIRDIDLILDNTDFTDEAKVREVKAVVGKYYKQ